MIDEDKTREQLIAELSQMRKRLAELEADGAGLNACALRALHRSPTVTFVWRACDGWPVSFVSEGIRRYGHVPHDLVGLVHHERYVAAEDLPAFIAAFAEASTTADRSLTREYRIVTHSGENRWVRERLWIERDDTGAATLFTGSLVDIQRLRDLEAAVREQQHRLAALFEHSAQPILLHDPSGRCIDANLAACNYLGYARDELLQMPLDTILTPESAARALRLARTAEGQEATIEGSLIGRDGDLLLVAECRTIAHGDACAILTAVRQERTVAPAVAAPPADSAAAHDLGQRLEALESAYRDLQQKHDGCTATVAENEERLRRYEVLLRDIHHRVKNNLQVIASLLGLEAEHIEDPRALDAFTESQNRIRAIALVHERVYQSSDLARVDLGAYVQDLAERMFVALGATPEIALNIDVEPISLTTDTAVPCGLLLGELLSNALKHAFPNGRNGSVHVALHRHDESTIALTVGDDGVGLPEGLDYRQTESLGLQLVTILAEQIDATIDLDTGSGTRFTIVFPDGA
jgi:PAS domain S-box-containing protein